MDGDENATRDELNLNIGKLNFYFKGIYYFLKNFEKDSIKM